MWSFDCVLLIYKMSHPMCVFPCWWVCQSVCLSTDNPLPEMCHNITSCVITLSAAIWFSYWHIILENTHTSITSLPLRYFPVKAINLQRHSIPPSFSFFFWCLPFAGKLLIIPTSLRSRPTRSVALPAKCWQCKISATTRTLHTYRYCLQIVKMQLHVY